jgi:hypothetical protein
LSNKVGIVSAFIPFSNTCTNPRTVMVVHGYAVIALFTMFAP